MAEKIKRMIEGYTVAKKGYKPSAGKLDSSNPPKGGSGMEPAESDNSGKMPIDLVHKGVVGSCQLCISNSFSGETSFHKSIKKFSFPETSVKTIADFGEIGLQVFFRNPTMSPSNDSLDVGDNTVYPRWLPT